MDQTPFVPMNPVPGNTPEEEVKDTVYSWVRAELNGDARTLDRLLADDFAGIGPRGFMLTRDEWIQRHRSGDLTYQALSLDDMMVRLYGDAAIVTCTQIQQARYRDQDAPGQFREMLVLVRQERGWLLAGLQLSPILGPPTSGR